MYDSITDRQRERDLLHQIKSNPDDNTAFHTLVCANMRFVLFVLKEFHIPTTMPIMDIIQEGNIGLMRGIRDFDSEKFPNIKLVSYVVYWIRFFIMEYLERNKLYVNRSAMLLSDEEINSLEETQMESQGLFHAYKQEMNAVADTALADIGTFLTTFLTNREAAVIKLYFGINPRGEKKTLEAIGQQLHIRFVRVRQIRDQALEKLRESLETDEFGKFF